jgi:hypothetical protein
MASTVDVRRGLTEAAGEHDVVAYQQPQLVPLTSQVVVESQNWDAVSRFDCWLFAPEQLVPPARVLL